jgi:GTP-binding protein EngB required for normal cell division
MTEARLTPAAKPRIAIMGEFSAGKSTLCNLLLKARPLPEKVTATRLSPVWMTKGPGQHVRVTLDGEEHPVDLNLLDEVPIEETRYIRLFMDADILDHCDFIDFPGISDPNMDAEVWERVLNEADAVIWLTHATQAWRQTEAAVWDTVPEEVQENSILLITRFDKLLTDTDKSRVLNRVKKEAGFFFDAVFPISLLEAIEGANDFEAWQASGAEAFMEHLAELVGRLGQARADGTDEGGNDNTAEKSSDVAPVKLHAVEDTVSDAEPAAPRIMPRRVKPLGVGQRRRSLRA